MLNFCVVQLEGDTTPPHNLHITGLRTPFQGFKQNFPSTTSKIACECLGARHKNLSALTYVEVDVWRMPLLTAEESELLTRAANLMDELLETIEVTQDKELMRDLKVALKEAEEGRTRPLDELIRELNLED
jgi:hypothetical protein